MFLHKLSRSETAACLGTTIVFLDSKNLQNPGKPTRIQMLRSDWLMTRKTDRFSGRGSQKKIDECSLNSVF